ncbi:MAG: transglutaminase domain-containing protein [Pirellulales bacterium]|nr:transglutaminase domain-containing protein [Pirellulales bacterium]
MSGRSGGMRRTIVVGFVALCVGLWAAGQGRGEEPAGPAAFPASKDRPYYAVKLPIEGADCGGFFCSEGVFYLFDLAQSRLFRLVGKDRLALVDAMPGTKAADATLFAGSPHYCFRDRLIVRTAGKSRTVRIPGAETLRSLTTGPGALFVLDSGSRQILVLGPGYSVQRRLPAAGLAPQYLRFHDGALWLLDKQDRCVRKVDPASGQVLLRFHAGLRGASRGIVFVDDRLFVHEIESSWLRRVDWKQVGPVVYSWPHVVRMQYVHDVANVDPGAAATVRLRLAVPTDGALQQVNSVDWSAPPAGGRMDRFGQPLVETGDVAIAPGGSHRFAYEASIELVGACYDLPDVPLALLAKIPAPIRRMYLAPDPEFEMGSPVVRQLAETACNDAQGNPPAGVRSLIENIVLAMVERLSYDLDGRWERPTVVLTRGTGSCSEYSMIFSALARLNGLPTRMIGGIQVSEPGTKAYDTELFHRWNEVWFPEIGWVPVDVTKFDNEKPEGRHYDFIFGQPGYMIVLSRGGIDNAGLGMNYYVRALGRGGKRDGKTRVHVEPWVTGPDYPILDLKLP